MRRVPCGARSRVFATLAAALGGAVCGCGREGDREGAREGATPFRHVVLEGTALEMGRAQGRLLREAIRARVAEPIDPAVAASLALFAPPMRDLLPPAFAEELAGIAEGAGVDVDALFLREIVRDGRRWHDLPTPLVRAAFASAPGTAPCVVVAFDGLTAFAGAGAGAGRLVLVERRPAGRPATLVLALPGSLGGIVGVSARGVVVVSAEDGSLDVERRSLRGPPFAAGVRMALERGTDAETTLAALPRLLGNRVLVADAGNVRVDALVAGTGDDPVRSEPTAWVLRPAGDGDARKRNADAQDARLGAFEARPGCSDAVALAVSGRDTASRDAVLRFSEGRVDVLLDGSTTSLPAPR